MLVTLSKQIVWLFELSALQMRNDCVNARGDKKNKRLSFRLQNNVHMRRDNIEKLLKFYNNTKTILLFHSWRHDLNIQLSNVPYVKRVKRLGKRNCHHLHFSHTVKIPLLTFMEWNESKFHLCMTDRYRNTFVPIVIKYKK